MNKSSFFLKPTLFASLALALAFTVSCSSGDKDDVGGEALVSSSSDVSSSSGSEVSTSSSSVSVSSSSEASSSSGDSSSSSEAGSSSSSSSSSSIGIIDAETVDIDGQTWMKKNLNVSTESGSWCYDDNLDNCTKYGRLYDWATAMGLDSKCNSTLSTADSDCAISTPHRGICPEGFHIPTDADWDKLYRYVDSDYDEEYGYNIAGNHLKATSDWTASSYVENLDTYSFGALPGGLRDYRDGSFRRAGDYGMWWSAGEDNAIKAYSYYMYYEHKNASSFNDPKSEGYSVRCLQD